MLLPYCRFPFWRAIAAPGVPEAPLDRGLWHYFNDGSRCGILPLLDLVLATGPLSHILLLELPSTQIKGEMLVEDSTRGKPCGEGGWNGAVGRVVGV